MSDEQLLASILAESGTQRACLAARLTSLKAVLTAQKDVKRMLRQLQRVDDAALTADVLRAGALKRAALDLEGAGLALPLLPALLASQFEEHGRAALDALDLVLASFGTLIRGSREAMGGVGVDLSGEARQQRALACYDLIEGMAPQLARLATGGGPLNREAVEMLRSLRDQLGMPLSMPQV